MVLVPSRLRRFLSVPRGNQELQDGQVLCSLETALKEAKLEGW